MNGTTRVPKFVPRLVLDKVRQVLVFEVLNSNLLLPFRYHTREVQHKRRRYIGQLHKQKLKCGSPYTLNPQYGTPYYKTLVMYFDQQMGAMHHVLTSFSIIKEGLTFSV